MENQIVLGAAFAVITTLSGVIVWLVKSWIRQTNTLVNDCKKSLDRNTDVMQKVLELLTNWRGH